MLHAIDEPAAAGPSCAGAKRCRMGQEIVGGVVRFGDADRQHASRVFGEPGQNALALLLIQRLLHDLGDFQGLRHDHRHAQIAPAQFLDHHGGGQRIGAEATPFFLEVMVRMPTSWAFSTSSEKLFRIGIGAIGSPRPDLVFHSARRFQYCALVLVHYENRSIAVRLPSRCSRIGPVLRQRPRSLRRFRITRVVHILIRHSIHQHLDFAGCRLATGVDRPLRPLIQCMRRLATNRGNRMNRRDTVLVLLQPAQPAHRRRAARKLPRIGVLSLASFSSGAGIETLRRACETWSRRGTQHRVEPRSAEGRVERSPSLPCSWWRATWT